MAYKIILDIANWDEPSVNLLRQAVAMRRGKTLDETEGHALLEAASALIRWEQRKEEPSTGK